jgi:hypothetical protein
MLEDNYHNPIRHIICNKNYDWNFVINNPVLDRPSGDVIFVSRINSMKYTNSRVAILREKGTGELYFIAQVRIYPVCIEIERIWLRRVKNWNLMPPDDLINLGSPSFAIEWHFPTTHNTWSTLLKELKNISLPVVPKRNGSSLNEKRTILIKYQNDYTIHCWSVDEKEYKQVEEVMDLLLNYVLIKNKNAYIIPNNKS